MRQVYLKNHSSKKSHRLHNRCCKASHANIAGIHLPLGIAVTNCIELRDFISCFIIFNFWYTRTLHCTTAPVTVSPGRYLSGIKYLLCPLCWTLRERAHFAKQRVAGSSDSDVLQLLYYKMDCYPYLPHKSTIHGGVICCNPI
ncbi:hypothetical protein FKM82_008214 [Ascaphus truei]